MLEFLSFEKNLRKQDFESTESNSYDGMIACIQLDIIDSSKFSILTDLDIFVSSASVTSVSTNAAT
jgi:hypothetical protein